MSNKNKGKVILYLMRHGQTILNRAKRIQGWCDGVLTKQGIEVAINVGRGIRDVRFRAAYSSDLGRAVKTAQIVIKENRASTNLQLQELEGLREMYFGKYEGELEKVLFNDVLNYLNVKSFKEAEGKFDFQKEFCNTCAALDETKEAENYVAVINRVMEDLEHICINNSNCIDENVLIVTHGGIIRLIVDYFDKGHNVRNMSNSSITKLIYENEKFKVECVNDNSYSEVVENISTTS